jgi:hypothetical protein
LPVENGVSRTRKKLGELEDVEHVLDGVAGTRYGAVVQVLKRPVPGP